MKAAVLRGIRAILFDAVGTLFRARTSVGEIYRDVASGHGVEADANRLEERFQALAQTHGTPADRAGWRDRVRAVFPAPEEFADFDAFFEEVFTVFESGHGWRLYPETRDVLTRLRQVGFSLGVVTNFDDRVVGVLDHLGIGHLFLTVQTPQSSGYRKPDPRIFRQTSRILDVAPAETLMVGDHAVEDLEGSRAAGMHALLVDRRPNPGRASFIIPDLTPLPERVRHP
jgi:putative hydrolase of the HAD superfamily